ncbi:SoxR reducing system RseC family protein [Fusobacterium perfoetens]|uniref:SoxR reducing system RseC family protein n=1 Tax=Fusobacterium perfoetens TaxID=852 RepID=UPI00048813AD|nr:SoxR reducing system RseC family protein [Fusobacterium perfoetens]MCI6153265.1 SoxR reducing system RseC family protein [Fusobacterium perfoetens]MDY3238366.1 SoxR reducing system RseC family protein [Fusobacterium perfoetens]
MESSGKVTKINGRKITVKMFKESSCAHCSGCGEANKLTREIELDFNPKEREIKVGNIVTFELEDSKMLKIGFLVYVIPVIMMVVGFGIGSYLGKSEGVSVLYSFIGLFLTFLVIHLYDKFIVKEKVSMNITKVEEDTKDNEVSNCSTKK